MKEKFVAPLLTRLASFNHDDLNYVSKFTVKITKLIVDCSLPLVIPRVNRKRHGKRVIYAKLPDGVKAARFCSKNAFDAWNVMSFPIRVLSMLIIARSVGTIGNFYANI